MKKIAIFVEDRLFLDSSTLVRSGNRRLENLEWEKLGVDGHETILAARVRSVGSTESGHVVGGNVYHLPYFQGLKNGIFKLPALFVESYLLARKVDLVIAKCPGIVGNIGVLAGKIARKPVAIHFVGDIEDSIMDSRKTSQFSLMSFIARIFSQFVVRQAHAVRYPTRNFLQKKYPAKDSSKEFWYTDASITPLEELPDSPSFEFGKILAIGTQEKMYKGHDFLIKALKLVRKEVPEARLVLVGKGAYRTELEDLAIRSGLENHVEFIDFLDGWNEVSKAITSAHVFAMPSMAEGLPRALLEAMSLGTACVGSDASGIPELLPDYLIVPRGTIEPLAAILVHLLQDERARASAASACLEASRPFAQKALQPNIEAWQEQLRFLLVAENIENLRHRRREIAK